MTNYLSLELLLELPELILKTSNDQSPYLKLLSENLVEKYYKPELKKEIVEMFRKFNDVKYMFTNSHNYSLTSSANNLSQVVVSQSRSNDKVANFVMKNVDLEIWASDMYFKVLSIAHKLTYSEAIYFVDTFFGDKTEEHISEKLCICRKTLQKIKKSCLVKIYLEMNC